jgi:hypothetical protein
LFILNAKILILAQPYSLEACLLEDIKFIEFGAVYGA